MAEAFTSRGTPESAVVGRLDEVERAVLVDALEQVGDLLAEGENDAEGEAGASSESPDLFASLGHSMREREAPEDPALKRLLPDAAPDDAASAEFRRFTESSLRATKRANLSVAAAAFAREPRDGLVVLTRDEARAGMMALTDVRLVLAERLGVRTDEDAEALHAQLEEGRVPSSEQEYMAASYDFFTWVAESLTLAYTGQA